MDIMTYGLVFLGWVVGGTIGGSTGMGAVMSAMPFLTWVVALSDAVIICLLVSLFDCTQLAYLYRKGRVERGARSAYRHDSRRTPRQYGVEDYFCAGFRVDGERIAQHVCCIVALPHIP